MTGIVVVLVGLDDGDDDVGDEQVGTGQLISSTAKQLKPAGILD